MIYAYARVSTINQKLNRQLDNFMALNIPNKNIYCDKKSGKDFDRTNYLKLCRKLKKGDLLVIYSIDRLGRNYDMIIEEWTRITKNIGADIFVVDMPLLDTRTRAENITGKLISDIVLQLLSYVAQKERENIHERQKQGIASAKLRGVKFGRPLVPLCDDFHSIVSSYKNKEITLDDALVLTKLRRSTFYARMSKELS